MNFRTRLPEEKGIFYLANAMVFNVKSPATGRQLFEKVHHFFSTFKRPSERRNFDEFPFLQIKVGAIVDKMIVDVFNDDKKIPLTNKSKGICAIQVEFDRDEVLMYIDYKKCFEYLPLDVGMNEVTVYDCLKLFTAPEMLETPWHCTSCKETKETSKQLRLWRLPEVLILQLKRFIGGVVGLLGGYGRKYQDFVSFPIRDLDLTSFLPDEQKDCCETPKYDLFAVINHQGIMEGGHYWAYVRTDAFAQCPNMGEFVNDSEEQEEWSRFNDQKVTPIKKEEVVSQCAYLLFYRRQRRPN